MAKKPLAKQVEAVAAAPLDDEPEVVLNRRNGLSSGLVLLNLALTDNPFFAFLKGHYYYMVGDSDSGKSISALTIFAEATTNPRFNNYRLIYDKVESSTLINTDQLFGMAMTDRLEPPAKEKDGGPRYSHTAEEFYYHVDDAALAGKPFIYILDSMDALDTDAAGKKFNQHKNAYKKARRREDGEEIKGDEKEEKVTGSYGDGKAKINSTTLRKALQGVKATGSILLIISQTRDNPASQYGGKTRAGGHALRFYATAEWWSSIVEVLKKTVREKARRVGVRVKFSVRKNHQTGKFHEVLTDIYPSYGIDDIGACIDYLLEEGWWNQAKQSISATEFKLTATREKLIAYIESSDKGNDLKAIVGQCWAEIEAACAVKRKRRYI
jgi:ABC-type dipeptide/oligopeptide/nickel transport system ATPase component